MKPWQLSRRIDGLSEEIAEPTQAETRIDINCLSQPERQLFERIDEIIDEYKPASPPKDVIEKTADLWNKGLEIFARRTMELFVDIMPASLCCDELEEWYFKLYFHNFLLDWIESVHNLREMPKEQHDALLCERKEMSILDKVFRLHRSQPQTVKTLKRAEGSAH